MARLNVSPTRMELARLKSKLRVAVKGHKLLKDKFDEMMRQFRARIKQNRELRKQVEEKINEALGSFLIARTQLDSQQIQDAVAMPAATFNIMVHTANIMGVRVPKLEYTRGQTQTKTYRNASLENALTILQAEFGNLIKLAEVEKTCEILSQEIEKNRRRINAIEHIIIPQINDTIKYITMKLGENERQNVTRLMKVKQLYGE